MGERSTRPIEPPPSQYRHQLAVKIQHKFMRSGAQADGIHFMDALVLDVLFEQVGGEYTAFEQEFVIGFERIQHFA